jgi:hypothetical protein
MLLINIKVNNLYCTIKQIYDDEFKLLNFILFRTEILLVLPSRPLRLPHPMTVQLIFAFKTIFGGGKHTGSKNS